MEKNPQFDDIRPYYEEEIPAAMQRIATSDVFPLLASFVYPGESIEKIRERVCAFTTTKEFQHDTMRRVNEQVIARSTTGATISGLDRLDPDKNYLFVSNHRDIMLDASLLQYFFVINGFETTEITFGANLMMNPVVIDVGKSNKMFRVERPGGDLKEFYRKSLHLSEYIRYTIKEKKQSVWIAQRNGRTKNGIDATDQGIIKMFCMSEPHNKIKALADLHIAPVAISYEWEPCDILKALELYESQYTRYTKKPGEDLNSILTGIMQQKGRVHIELCQPISVAELSAFENQTNNEYHKSVAKLIDRRINTNYRLYPNNYIAHDLLYGNTKYRDMYTDEQYETFQKRLSKLDKYDTCDIDRLKEIFVGIYSNPVDNR
ncbi:MAG: 1-acyl-sn-glycerol-3-phosphate acyltransferase [Prevotella sp.]|jgi:1-acyl-sn-glycerol-3-phosphate acyltransferase|nr:1-acyl-sn-glycerol-3-phosphate acyltransferase [Prevotella sp.]